MFEVIIPWVPTSWLAPKFSRGHVYDPREAEKRSAAHLIRTAYKEATVIGLLITDYVALEFFFHFRPGKVSKKKRAEMIAGLHYPTRYDCTNMQKLYEDCLKKTVISDDRNVVKIYSEKLYSEKDQTIIRIYTLKEYENYRGRS